MHRIFKLQNRLFYKYFLSVNKPLVCSRGFVLFRCMNWKIFFSAFLSVCLIACNTPSNKEKKGTFFDNAVAYNDYIIQRQTSVIDHILLVSEAMAVSADSVDQLLKEGVAITDIAIADVKEMGPFKGDTVFRNSALANFDFYRTLFTTDYKSIVEINKKGEAATGDDFQRIDSIQTAIMDKESELDKRLHNAQADFAQKNRMSLPENELQKKVDTAQ